MFIDGTFSLYTLLVDRERGKDDQLKVLHQ